MPIVELNFNPNVLKGARSHILDHLRWISALAVTAAHVRNIFFPDYSELVGVPGLVKAFYFLTLFGTQAVVVFFVVSGLLVGGGVVRKVRGNSFCLHEYLIDRFARLYVVLVPAVFLSVALRFLVADPGCEESALRVMGNLLFMQNVLVRPICNNFPLWSLSNEGVYYILAGVVAVFFVSAKWRMLSLVSLLFIFGFLLSFEDFGSTGVVSAAPLWLLGLLPWFVRVRVPYYISCFLFLIVLTLSRVHAFDSEYIEKLSIGVSLALCLCCSWDGVKIPSGAWMAKFSYSLYLVHMPTVLLFSAFVPKLSPYKIGDFVIYLTVMCVILAVAYLFWWLFESRTSALRTWVLGLWGRRSAMANQPGG